MNIAPPPDKLPILIPAHNEEDLIWGTLDNLPRNCYPIVLANGCTDQTAKIASSFGDIVEVLEEPSKFRALQHALKHLGETAAGNGYAIMDADTHPVFPSHYVSAALGKLANYEEVLVHGQLAYRKSARPRPISGFTAWTFASVAHKLLKRYTDPDYRPVTGPLMLLKTRAEVLNRVVDEPNDFWPAEDLFISELHEAYKATRVVTFNPLLAAMTECRHMEGPFAELWRKGMGEGGISPTRQGWWGERPTEGKINYLEWKRNEGINSPEDLLAHVASG